MLLNCIQETKKSINIFPSKTTWKHLGMVRTLPITKLNIGLAFQITELWQHSLLKRNDRVTEVWEAPSGDFCIRGTHTVMNHYDSVVNNDMLKLWLIHWSICYKFENFITMGYRHKKIYAYTTIQRQKVCSAKLLNFFSIMYEEKKKRKVPVETKMLTETLGHSPSLPKCCSA